MGHLAGNMVTRTETQIGVGPLVAMDGHRKDRAGMHSCYVCDMVTAMMRALKETWLLSMLAPGADG